MEVIFQTKRKPSHRHRGLRKKVDQHMEINAFTDRSTYEQMREALNRFSLYNIVSTIITAFYDGIG